RMLTIQPGGIVPWHQHADRPAIAYLLEGEITEYASNCAVPVEHKPGDVIVETPNLSHSWKNFSDKKAGIISADLLKGDDDNMQGGVARDVRIRRGAACQKLRLARTCAVIDRPQALGNCVAWRSVR